MKPIASKRAYALEIGDIIKRRRGGVEYIVKIEKSFLVAVETHASPNAMICETNADIAVYGNVNDNPELLSSAKNAVGFSDPNKKLLR